MAHEQMNGASVGAKKAEDFESKSDPSGVPASLPSTNSEGAGRSMKDYGTKTNSADPANYPLRAPSEAQE